MQPDPYCCNDSAYMVNSLYFDTGSYDFFSQKIEGEKYRYKVRLRSYGQQESKVFLEMKKKINNCIYKVRGHAPYADVCSRLPGPMQDNGTLFGSDGCFDGVDEILLLARRLKIRPTVQVCYRRQALMGQNDNRLRITFDQDIVSRHPRCGLSFTDESDRLFPHGITVLEIKVDNAVPFWLVQIIEKFNLNLRSISKYCHAVAKQNILQLDTRY